jgi:ribose 1,5-bisphosphokinase
MPSWKSGRRVLPGADVVPSIAYVMGPSGAGKDTLLDLARRELAGSTILFAHRFITRDAAAGHENFIGLSPEEFALRARLDLFAFAWEAHGLRYGISREIELWRKTGCSVVISGSRAHFAQNLMQRQDVTPIRITAPPELLAGRLRQRAREDEAAIALRLQRAAAFQIAHPRLIEIVNNDAPQDAAARLTEALRAL